MKERPTPPRRLGDKPSERFLLYELHRQQRQKPHPVQRAAEQLLAERLGRPQVARSIREQMGYDTNNQPQHFPKLVEQEKYQPTPENLKELKPNP